MLPLSLQGTVASSTLEHRAQDTLSYRKAGTIRFLAASFEEPGHGHWVLRAWCLVLQSQLGKPSGLMT